MSRKKADKNIEQGKITESGGRTDPGRVHRILGRHMLVSGYDLVLDLEKSRGVYLHDSRTGRDYLDFFTFYASSPLGMNHERLAGDEDFVRKLGLAGINKPSNSDIYTEEMAAFVDTFSRVGIPDYLPHAFFVSGGALAVENAMKTAFDWKVQKNFEKGYRTEKGHKVLHLDRAFHGRSGYTLSVTHTDPAKTRYFPKFDWPRISSPAVRYPLDEENLQQTEQLENQALMQAERHFEIHKDDIACILLEPIQGEGGDNHFRLEFHQALRDLADRHDALLVYDEVQTGVGLTGKFWCHEHYVRPDIIAFGKKTQVCGILAGRRIDEVEDNCFRVPSRINSTWGGSLVDMVRFTRILEVIEDEGLTARAADTGARLLDKLTKMARAHEYLDNPRGLGLFCAIDLPEKRHRDAVIAECRNNGLLILGCGDLTIRFRPPLTVGKSDIDKGLQIIEQSCQSVLGGYAGISGSPGSDGNRSEN